MDLRHLEEEVYDALRHEFIVEEDDDEYNDNDGRNFCTVPPGILLEILNTIVVPVVTALISECLIRKLMPEKDNRYDEIREDAHRLNDEAQREIEQRSEEILCGDRTPDSITRSVSGNLTVNITVNSPQDAERILAELEQYLRGNSDNS